MDLEKLKNVKTLEDLKMAKAKFYHPESEFNQLKQAIRDAKLEEKANLGKKLSALKKQAEKIFHLKAIEIKENIIKQKVTSEWIDINLPIDQKANLHPLSLVEKRFCDWLTQNGYYQSRGSEIESDEYNFTKLNMPIDHPARDMQDSLYLKNKLLLRTHNTGFSARELAKNVDKAFSHFAIGSVYRNDEDDATHSHQFRQVDLVSVGEVNFKNLIWTLQSLLSYVLESEVKIRLRPSYFPFTEPSVEVDVYFNQKWLEILGAGMLHPNVLKEAGYTNGMQAFAAGIGIERIAMMKYGINDIREFYKNDLRFLNQFQGGK